jgi:hypothetical protein
MVTEADLLHERIQTLKEYIQYLEKIRGVVFGFWLSPADRTVLQIVDRKIGWSTELLAGLAGLGMFLASLSLGRLIARSLALLVGVIIAAGLIALATAVYTFCRVRRQIADHEIKLAQIEIYRLESLLNE